MKRAHKYDVLRRPSKVRMTKPKVVTDASLAEARQRAERDVQKKYLERVDALFKWGRNQGHSNDTILAVLGALIEFDAPGFRVEVSARRSDGAGVRWEESRLAYLWLEVQAIVERTGCTEREACKQLFRKMNNSRAYKGAVTPRTLGTLRRRFNEAKKCAMVIKLARGLEAYGGLKAFAIDLHDALERSPEAVAALEATGRKPWEPGPTA